MQDAFEDQGQVAYQGPPGRVGGPWQQPSGPGPGFYQATKYAGPFNTSRYVNAAGYTSSYVVGDNGANAGRYERANAGGYARASAGGNAGGYGDGDVVGNDGSYVDGGFDGDGYSFDDMGGSQDCGQCDPCAAPCRGPIYVAPNISPGGSPAIACPRS